MLVFMTFVLLRTLLYFANDMIFLRFNKACHI